MIKWILRCNGVDLRAAVSVVGQHDIPNSGYILGEKVNPGLIETGSKVIQTS